MTREEAIQDIKDILEEATSDKDAVCYVTSEDAEALNMAIEALSADGVGRYENAMQKLREMPKYLNGVKEKQITKISDDEVVLCKDCRWYSNNHLCEQLSRFGSIEPLADFYCAFGERREP